MKAEYLYRSGSYLLLLPRTPIVSLLFLEYIRDCQRQGRETTFYIMNGNSGDDEYFIVWFRIKELYLYSDAVNYINANL